MIGNGVPDIYDVTYRAGGRSFTELWEGPKPDEYRFCPPHLFDGEPDRLDLNRGDGGFDDVSATAGILAPESKGLGAVAADFELSGRLNLFVANDMAANFYFVKETPSPGAPRQLDRRAIAGAVAHNAGRR